MLATARNGQSDSLRSMSTKSLIERISINKPKITTESITSDFNRSDVHGQTVKKLAEALSQFNLDRDGIMLEAFRTKMLNFPDFRMLLKRALLLSFTDEEFGYVCDLFDRDDSGTIDGEEFLVVCKILGNAWRKRCLKRNRESRKEIETALKEKADKEQAEREAVLENAADFLFTPDDEKAMLNKIKAAACKINKIEPGAPPLHGFEPKYLKPKEVEILVRNTFRVSLSRKELGALIRMFDYEARGLLDTTTFLVRFSRWGTELRADSRLNQIEMSRSAQKAMQDYNASVLKALEEERESKLDLNFTEADEESALHKLKVAAKRYHKHHSSSVALDGFEGTTLTPGLFRDMLRRTFNVHLSGKELGALVTYFQYEDSGDISCKAFLVHFGRTGTMERFKDRSEYLQSVSETVAVHIERREKRMERAHKRNLMDEEVLKAHSETDKESAIRKLKFAARHYSLSVCDIPGDLDVFKVDKMTPGVFQEKLQMFLGVILTTPELAAMVVMFDATEKDEKFVDCDKFSKFFKKLGFAEKERLWAIERERRQAVLDLMEEHQNRVKENFKKMVETGAVDYNYSPEDEAKALKKMEIGASFYDPNSPQAISLNAFDTYSITPGELKEKLKRTFNIDLKPKQLGAIASRFLLEDGSIECSELVAFIKTLMKDRKEQFRLARLKAERAQQELKRRADQKRAEDKIHSEREKLKHEAEDEHSLMKKLNIAAQAFAVDNASFLRVLHPVKNPSLTPASFRAAFYRIFLVNLTYPELGLIMRTVNEFAAKHHLIDGVSFLKGFYRIARLQQEVLLGNLNESELTLSLLHPAAQIPPALRALLSRYDDRNEDVEEQTLASMGLSVRSTAATVRGFSMSMSPRLSHWNHDLLEQEGMKRLEERRRLKSSECSVDSNAIAPMLPHILEGSNPWVDWGLAEAGFLPQKSAQRSRGNSRSHSRLHTASSVGPSSSGSLASTSLFTPGSTNSSQIHLFSPVQHNNDSRRRRLSFEGSDDLGYGSDDFSIQSSISGDFQDFDPTGAHELEGTRTSATDSLTESYCAVSVQVPEPEVVTDIPVESESSLNLNMDNCSSSSLPQLSMSSPNVVRPESQDRSRSSHGKKPMIKKPPADPLKSILRPSLPMTFSSIGLARQMMK